MVGLILLGVLAIYGIAVLFITRAGARIGAGEKKSRKGAWLGGSIAFLLVTAPMTWDTIPTIIAYRENCSKAGLVVFKDVEQWKRENPDVEKVVTRKKEGYRLKVIDNGQTDYYQINSQFADTVTRTTEPYLRVTRYRIVEISSGTVLAEQKVISTGKGELKLYDRINGLDDFKFWLNFGACSSSDASINPIIAQFKNLGVEK